MINQVYESRQDRNQAQLSIPTIFDIKCYVGLLRVAENESRAPEGEGRKGRCRKP